MTPALEGRFFRALSLAPVMRELSLINVRFSTNGITRLAQFLLDLNKGGQTSSLKKLQLINNGFEEYNS
jgi:hypothetical protein